MAREKENCCVGCAECVGCGRKYRYHINLICDKCGTGGNECLWDVNGEELCDDCARGVLWEEIRPDDFYSRIDGEEDGDGW